jgi:hypothetical protein
MQVEPALHQFAGIAFEISPVVVVGEPRLRDFRARRNPPQRLLRRLVQRLVDRLEFVILIFAHEMALPENRGPLPSVGETRAFSSEVATGSREENASKQKPGARFGFHQNRKSSRG